uniref:Premnaspirodiene oxygenase-like n=1 Tax=Elaeis guineensis var. tenera TaxID=51953 RepID=A0A6I9QKT0_ELAGV|nr:premnaspirodiene oxygenase-like [Elaeis guineensis]
MLLKLGEVNTLVVSSPEAAREIMKTHDITFANRPMPIGSKMASYGGKDLIFAPYGDYWRDLRKMCVLELLSAKRVQSFQAIREEEVHNLIRSISSMKTTSSLVNLSQKLFMLNNDIIMRAVVGNRCKDQNTFILALTEMIKLAGGFGLADLFPSSLLISRINMMASKLPRYQQKVGGILDDIIHDHQERKKAKLVEEDLLDVLLRIREEGGLPSTPLTLDEIKAVILDMFGAGTETSSTTLDWAMAELMKNPKVLKRAQAEVRELLCRKTMVTESEISDINYLKLVIKETLRLHPPVPLLVPRESRERVEVLGYEIPEKVRVLVNAWALGRDPQIWDDAEEFKPERFDGSTIDFKGTNFEFVPFGAGRRICPGISFALANVELTLACLLYYFNWELPDGMEPSDLDMAESFGMTSRRKLELCLRAIPVV